MRRKADVLLWGDSHARALLPGLGEFIAERHLRLRAIMRSGCPPLVGIEIEAPAGGSFARCTALNRAALAAILKDPALRLVILEARWEKATVTECVARGVSFATTALRGVMNNSATSRTSSASAASGPTL